MRSLLRAIALTTVVLLSGAAPLCLALAAWPGPAWAALGCVPALAALAVAFLGSEGIVARAHGAPEEGSAPLGGTLARVLEERGPRANVARVALFPNPIPAALVARSLRGSGTVLISEGAAVRLTEPQLREVLGACLERARAPGIVIASACAVISSWLLRAVPPTWLQSVFGGAGGRARSGGKLGVFGAAVLVAVYPAFRALEAIGRQAPARLDPLEARGAAGSLDSERIGIPNPGFLRLYMGA
jgi:hypothetical protein